MQIKRQVVKPEKIVITVEITTNTRGIKISNEPGSMPVDIVAKTLLNAVSSLVKPSALFYEDKTLQDIIADFNIFFHGSMKRWEGKTKYDKPNTNPGEKTGN